MNLDWLRPKKSAPVPVKVVANLDALVLTPIGVQINGKVVHIKPMSVEQMAIVSMRLAEIVQLKQRNDAGTAEWKEADASYKKLFADSVEGLSAADMSKMQVPQILALYQLIIDCYAGRAQVDAEKKNVN
jgi:hypothetical protein